MKIEIPLTVNYLALHTFVKTKHNYEKTALLLNHNILVNQKNIYLEKEVHQPEAVKIYQRLGFELTSVFGCYQYDPLSLYRVKNWLVVLGER